MWLDELVVLAEKLRARATKERERLRGKETRTRYALIDPMLSALGWDVHDPTQAIPEYTEDQLGRKRLDYALFGPGPRPIVLVEAKALGAPLDDGFKQARDYCDQTGIRHFAVTDGNAWRIYDLRRDGPLHERIVVEFVLDEQDLGLAMSKLWEWRAGLIGGRAPDVAPVPTPPRAEDREAAELFQEATEPVVMQSRWVLIDVLGVEPNQSPPTQIKFPGGDVRQIQNWGDLQRRVVEWASQQGILADKCPISGPRGGIVVGTRPYKRDGAKFDWPQQVPGQELYWNKGWDAVGHHRMAKIILEAVEVPLKDVQVETSA